MSDDAARDLERIARQNPHDQVSWERWRVALVRSSPRDEIADLSRRVVQANARVLGLLRPHGDPRRAYLYRWMVDRRGALARRLRRALVHNPRGNLTSVEADAFQLARASRAQVMRGPFRNDAIPEALVFLSTPRPGRPGSSGWTIARACPCGGDVVISSPYAEPVDRTWVVAIDCRGRGRVQTTRRLGRLAIPLEILRASSTARRVTPGDIEARILHAVRAVHHGVRPTQGTWVGRMEPDRVEITTPDGLVWAYTPSTGLVEWRDPNGP